MYAELKIGKKSTPRGENFKKIDPLWWFLFKKLEKLENFENFEKLENFKKYYIFEKKNW